MSFAKRFCKYTNFFLIVQSIINVFVSYTKVCKTNEISLFLETHLISQYVLRERLTFCYVNYLLNCLKLLKLCNFVMLEEKLRLV